MQYGIIHKPLMVKVLANRRNPDKAVAFINRHLCFFEKDKVVGEVGSTVEVMISRCLYSSYPEGHEREGGIDFSRLRAIMIEQVDRNLHDLVAIDGFECTGTMCRTKARGKITDGTRELTSEDIYPKIPSKESDRLTMWLTPGRCGIYEANNVNRGRLGTPPAVPRRPTNVWIEKSQFIERSGCGVRVAGLSRVEDAGWAHLVNA